jgi:hypothetical protein
MAFQGLLVLLLHLLACAGVPTPRRAMPRQAAARGAPAAGAGFCQPTTASATTRPASQPARMPQAPGLLACHSSCAGTMPSVSIHCAKACASGRLGGRRRAGRRATPCRCWLSLSLHCQSVHMQLKRHDARQHLVRKRLGPGHATEAHRGLVVANQLLEQRILGGGSSWSISRAAPAVHGQVVPGGHARQVRVHSAAKGRRAAPESSPAPRPLLQIAPVGFGRAQWPSSTRDRPRSCRCSGRWVMKGKPSSSVETRLASGCSRINRAARRGSWLANCGGRYMAGGSGQGAC